ALTLSAGSTNTMQVSTTGFDVLKGAGTNALTLAGETVFDFTGNTAVSNGSTYAVFTNWSSVVTNGATFSTIGLETNLSLDVRVLASGGTITLVASGTPASYTLTVNSGTGDGSYTNGTQVAISADTPASGMAFDRWIGDTQVVNNVTYTNALVTMSTHAVTLTATYADVYYVPGGSATEVTIRTDVDYSTTVVLENFSGMNNPATAMIRATFNSITNGAATYNFAANTNSGYIAYSPTATSFNPALYKSVRIRMALNRDSAASTSVNVYPTPVVAGAFITKSVSSGTTLTETSFDFSALSPDGKGVRIDPFLYTNDGTVDQLQIDYIMADLGRTIGFEFNHDGDLNKAGLQNISSTNVANGVLSCTAATEDAQVWLTGGGGVTNPIDVGIYKVVEIRLKATAGPRFYLFWNTAAKGSLIPALVVEASADGGWHSYLLDFSAETNWTGNLTAFRLDPVNTLTGATFELDYVRFMETIPFPPPAPTDLSAVAGCRQVALSWTASAGASGYKVMTSNSVTHVVETHAVSSPPCTKIGLSNGTLYYFAVAATNAVGESAYTTPVSVSPFSGTSSTNLMQRESVVFCSDLQPRSARLLFPPVEIQSVKRADGSRVFTQGVDYTVSTDGLISLTTNSAIPVLTYYTNVIDATYYRFADTNGAAFYSPGGNYKHSAFDVVVTYTYTNGSLGELEAGAWKTSLTAAMDKLRVGQPLNMTFFGDSITAGAQASSLAPAVEPFAPAYPSQVVAGLKARFGYDRINYAN
ncbi:MAG: hypothetical protein WCG03_10665, partial [Kiritimatiellales bacterium]